MTHYPTSAAEAVLLIFLIAFVVIGILDMLGAFK